MKKSCELMESGKCLGCTGLAEEDWGGKYTCAIYRKIKEEQKINDNQIAFIMQK